MGQLYQITTSHPFFSISCYGKFSLQDLPEARCPFWWCRMSCCQHLDNGETLQVLARLHTSSWSSSTKASWTCSIQAFGVEAWCTFSHGGWRAAMTEREVTCGDHAPRRLQHGGGAIMRNDAKARRLACSTGQRCGWNACNVVLEGRPGITIGIIAERLLRAIKRRVAEENVMTDGWHMTSKSRRHVTLHMHLPISCHVIVWGAVHILHKVTVGLVPIILLLSRVVRNQSKGCHWSVNQLLVWWSNSHQGIRAPMLEPNYKCQHFPERPFEQGKSDGWLLKTNLFFVHRSIYGKWVGCPTWGNDLRTKWSVATLATKHWLQWQKYTCKA